MKTIINGIRKVFVMKLRGKLFFYFFLFSILISVLSIGLFYFSATEKALADTRIRVNDIVTLAAHNLDAVTHSKLDSKSMQKSQEYNYIQKKLLEVKKISRDIFSVYTVRQGEEGKVYFVADSEYGKDIGVEIGESYDDASELLKSNIGNMNTTLVDEDLYTDDWGTWLSGYAPFYLPDGTRDGILVVDISAETITRYRKQLQLISLIIFILTLPFSVIIGFLLGKKFADPIIQMKEAAEKIGSGVLDTHVNINRSDELGQLGNTLNLMAGKLEASQISINEMLNKYKGIFDNAMEGIFQATAEGEIITANNAFVKMLEFDDFLDLKNIHGNMKEALFAEEGEYETIMDILNEKKILNQFETTLIKKDGSLIWVELNVHQIEYSNKCLVIEGIVHDITNKREKEKAQKEKEIAQAASEAKSEFLANMSHEIRTPLNAVMGLTDLILRTDLNNKQREYLNKIKISSKTLLAVINDILDFSKIEAGRLELEETRFSLYEVMANISEIFAQNAHEKKIELLISIDNDTPNALIGDPVRLGQILINLTGNALKFTSEGEIVVSVKAIENETDNVILEFEVRDTGVGIKPERISNIFESFTQEDTSTTRKFGGTGLGLSICKKLTELMDGNIRAESEFGKGSSFIFTIKVKKQSEDKQLKLYTPVNLQGMKVLIVDDNQTSREILSQEIESFKMKSVTVENAERGLEILEKGEEEFDLILMDWKLPGMNGIEASKKIKNLKTGEKTPIIFMVSAYAREDLLQESEKSFIDAFIHKPVNQSFLFDTIVELFGKESGENVVSSDIKFSMDNAGKFRNENVRVLLVEDNLINQEIAREWLESAGMKVEIADNGKKAVEMVNGKEYDLVLMDIQLPEMDGYTATREIRKNSKFRELPIIAMTAHALKGDREKCLEAGMNDYITKPIDPEKMFSTICEWINTEEEIVIEKEDVQKEGQFFIKGINTELGLYRCGGNAELYEKLLKSFREEYHNVIERVINCIDNSSDENEYEALRLVHSVKGVSANLGIEGIYAKSMQLESLMKNRQLKDKNLIMQLSDELDFAFEGIDSYFTGENEKQEEKQDYVKVEILDNEEIERLLIKIKTMVDEDIVEAESLLEKIIPTLKTLKMEDEIKRIKKNIDDFDIESAVNVIDEIIKDLGELKNG